MVTLYIHNRENSFSCLLLLQMNFPDSLAELSYVAFLDVRSPVPFRDTSHLGIYGIAVANLGIKARAAKLSDAKVWPLNFFYE